jgi:hypothetical protein
MPLRTFPTGQRPRKLSLTEPAANISHRRMSWEDEATLNARLHLKVS